jgi:AbrB family looped-hinge helix DNA binding protein
LEAPMRVTSKGQVTIPIALREKTGIMPNTEVEFALEGNTILLRKKPRTKGKKGKTTPDWIRRMVGAATVKLTTDEIMKMTRDW